MRQKEENSIFSKIKMSDDRPRHETSPVYDKFRLDGKFCDAIIRVKDVEFLVHKVILCNLTPYFRAVFSCWNDPDQRGFNIPGLSPEMMKLLIEYAYTSPMSVTEDNVQELMIAADQFNVMGVVKICSDFLVEHLCPENCIGTWQFTNTSFFPELQSKAFRYIIDHFEEIVPCTEFLQQLTVQELSDIIGRDDLNVRLENTVFEAIMKWIAHKPTERSGHITTLLSKVRLSLMTLGYISDNVLPNNLVRSKPECLSMVTYATNVIYRTATNRPLDDMGNPFVRPRLPNVILLATGGWRDGDPSNAIEAYDFRTKCWMSVPNIEEPPRAYHGAVFLNGFVYYIGGIDRHGHLNTMRKFDPRIYTWEEAAPMYFRRCYVSVTVLDGCIYALGGFNGHERLKTAECYHPRSNQWRLIAPMHDRRSDASCTTFHSKIYICGGFTGTQCLQTAEYYTPATNQWTVITSMNSERSGIGVVAYADRIYAVGGFDGIERLCSVEAYNPWTNTWREMPSMKTTRSNFGIEVIDNRLFAVGGFNGDNTTNHVEYYDATANEWSEACTMKSPRSALSCCLLYGLPNMAEYTYPRDSLPRFHLDDELSESESSD